MQQKNNSSCNWFFIKNGICISEIDIAIRIKYRNIENDSNVHGVDVSLVRIVSAHLNFVRNGLHTIIISYAGAKRKDYLQARETKESPV